ncbi:MAG: DUF262 domain-containing protein [Nitrospiria bacterium]
MAQENEIPIDDNLAEDPEETIPFRYAITGYGADYPVDGLVKRIADGSINIPSFQRGFVWPLKMASRFIESLLLGLPVPGIFLAKEYETQKLLVIDGQQRLRTLQYFYEGIFADSSKVFTLKGVQPQFEGATYKSLNDEDRRRLDDSILHATIIKQDEPSDDDSSIYHIFERLNTEGLQLQPQEIRACMYHGEFNDLLKNLNEIKPWRSIYGPISRRMRDQELILRFLALYFNFDNYEKPMKEFLNIYLGKNRNLRFQSEDDVRNAFVPTIDIIHKCLGNSAFKPRKNLNAAVFDAVMVGIGRRLTNGAIRDLKAMQRRYQALLKNSSFSAATETGTSAEESVNRRIILATDAFANVT